MPKRKRNEQDDGEEDNGISEIREHLAQSKKLLHRALKTAKGFERQKLGKRIKAATTNYQDDAAARINREIEALKGLNLDKIGEAHLYKGLLKIKAFAESEKLPEEVRGEVWKPAGEQEVVAALRNVVSGMLNMKAVKEVLDQAIHGMYNVMGISAPVVAKKNKEKEARGILRKPDIKISRREASDEPENAKGERKGERKAEVDGSEESSFEGFDTEDKEDTQPDTDGTKEDEAEDEALDEDTLAHYDALIGASSDEESFDEEEYKRKHPPQPQERLSLSLSPTPSGSQSSSSLASLSNSPEPESRPLSRTVKAVKAKPVPLKAGSTFLPTLMGGYWSGSEESASDLDDVKPVRKNRKGQMARRAIAEKKYGERANHIKSGQGPVAEMKGKNDGWDAKRGAKDAGGRGGREYRGVSVNRGTNENALPVEPRKRGMGRKDDVGVLHPSWQAAKKAKEMKKTAKFEGKKVVFD